MSYQEKRVVVATVSGLLILVGYATYGYSKYREVGDGLLNDSHFWATAMLATIAVGVLAIIVIQVIFHIFLAVAGEVSKEVSKKTRGTHSVDVNDKFEIIEQEDEMDKLIALRASKTSSIIIGVSFVVALLALYFGMPVAVMLNILFLSFLIGTLIEGFVQLYFYKNGIKND